MAEAAIKSKSSVKVQRPVVIKLSNGEKVQARINTVFSSGIAFLSIEPSKVNAILGFGFTLKSRKADHVFNIKGKVVRSYLKGDQYHNFVKFENLTKQEKGMLTDFIADMRDYRV